MELTLTPEDRAFRDEIREVAFTDVAAHGSYVQAQDLGYFFNCIKVLGHICSCFIFDVTYNDTISR